MADQKPTNRERVKEIVAGIEQNIQELFQSEKYFDYLRTMSRFHSYSVNNTILIHMQRPHAANPVAGFQKWKQFGRHVKKGETGLTIIAPTPLKKKIEEMRLDPDTKAPVLDPDGNVIFDEKTVEIPLFKPVKVFSADQTDGKPLPSLSTDLTGNVQQYEAFMEALRRTSPMPIVFGALEPDTDGVCSFTRQTITIREGMSEVQTVCAAVHEIGHAVLHDREKDRLSAAAGNTEPPKAKDKNTMEVEAESVSFAVCQYYGIDTSANSMGYIAGWSKDRSLPELKASLETITKTVSGLISSIDKHFAEICKEQGIDLTAQPEQPDTPEKFVSDLCGYLVELQEAGLVPPPTVAGLHDRANLEEVLMPIMREGGFSSFRSILRDVAGHTDMPTTGLLLDRLKKLSDQWDAALICKIEPVFGVDSTVDRSAIQTYYERDGQRVPFKLVFVGTAAECQRVVDALEAGTITMRDVRQPDFEPPNPPEQRYVYKMDVNLRMVNADDQHFIQEYERTEKGTLIPGQILFFGRADVCAGLLDQLNNGTLRRDDFFTVTAARVSPYTLKDGAELDALVGPDDKVYLGRRDHYDNRGHYLNNDHSLMHISDNDRVFNVISGVDRPRTQEELQATGYFTQEELENFTALPLHTEDGLEQTAPDVPAPPEQADEALPDTSLDEYPMPDSTMTLDDLAGLGYEETDLLPLSRDRGAELVDRDMTVYMVRNGEDPEMVFDREDLMEQPEGVMFAIPREEWEASQDFHAAVVDRMNHQEDRERTFLDHGGDCFAIYQLRHDDTTRYLAYEPLERIRQAGESPRRGNYELAYTGELAAGQDLSVLDKLWEKFNTNHPADYHRPSLSISDIIAIKQDGVVSCHYVDQLGFSALPGFFQSENYLKNAEMTVEDDLGMIDGIINNGPKATVAELEQQARSGQPISLMDLAEAAHRERGEKKSVLAKLNAPPPQRERKKTAPKKSAEKER